MSDTRDLDTRLVVLADRYQAIAIGAQKRLLAGDKTVSLQDVTNAQRDAGTLQEAAYVVFKAKQP